MVAKKFSMIKAKISVRTNQSSIMQGYPCRIVKSVVDWSSFPSDLLFLICQKLHLLSDFIHFRGVCKNWRMSVLDTISPTQLPRLIRYHWNHACVYSLSSCKIYTFEVHQKMKQKHLMGPGQTYVLARDYTNSSLTIFNPLNGEELPLPPLPVHCCKMELYPLYIAPNQPKDGIILLGKSGFLKYNFCQINGDKWSILDLESEIGTKPIACAFCNGMYFVNWRCGAPTNIINANTGQQMSVIKPPPSSAHYEHYDYLVESSGDILRVQVGNKSDLTFHIYRLDYGGDNDRWIEMSSIGDRILFWSHYLIPFICLYGISLRSCNVTGFKGNCIYLPTMGVQECFSLCRYDIGEKKTEFFPLSGCLFQYWFIPSLNKSQL